MLTTLYVENFVKGLANTTAGMIVLFASYPLFLMYDSYLQESEREQREREREETFSKLDDNLSDRVKSSLDKLIN